MDCIRTEESHIRNEKIVGPTLENIFKEGILKDKWNRNKKMSEAIEIHGYRQSEVARHLGMHYLTISNLLRNNA